VHYSDVIVRHDSPITRLEELEGRSLACNEPASHSGHTVTLHSLITMGARPGFLGPVVEAGFHQRAIRLVAAGGVDAAAIDSPFLAIELRDYPRLADRLRAVDDPAGGGRPPPPTRLKDQVREVLVGLAGDPPARPVLVYGLVDRFTPVGDGAYDDIRAMLATIEAAGWTSLTQTAVHP
jgi:phosphonate transport system substrate-binding protein